MADSRRLAGFSHRGHRGHRDLFFQTRINTDLHGLFYLVPLCLGGKKEKKLFSINLREYNNDLRQVCSFESLANDFIRN